MLTRRTVLLSAAAAGLAVTSARFGLLAPLAHAAAAEAASAFIKETGAALTAVVNSDASDEAKRASLGAVIERSVDVDYVARFCLGRFWKSATPEQQRQYTQLFHQVIVYSIAGHLGEYKGVSFTLDKVLPHEGDVAVRTTLVRPGNPPAQVDWVVSTASGAPRIVDLLAEGTSLRLTQRNDYASFLARNNNDIQALIEALKKQISGGA